MEVKILKTAHYPVYVGHGALDSLSVFLEEGHYDHFFVLVDENTQKHCLPQVSGIVESIPVYAGVIEVPAGEKHKELKTCVKIWEELTARKATRHSLLINLGGGMISDLGGFTASTFKRGMACINVPTTLLSQADASVGGKTGINFQNIKNHIGTFSNPAAVFTDPGFLKTLAKRQLLNGYAEIIKHALIADRGMWSQLLSEKQHPGEWPDETWGDIISLSLSVKISVVEEDPLEGGRRAVLNLGHTIGHALESFFVDKESMLHGEAVAAGMVCEAYLSWKTQGLSESELNEITDYITGKYPPVRLTENDTKELMTWIAHDKKNRGSKWQFTLLKSIGQAVTRCECNEAMILDAFQFYSKPSAYRLLITSS